MILQSHVLVSVIGDAFQVSKREESVMGGRDLIVESLRHKVSVHLCQKKALGLMYRDNFFSKRHKR